MAETDVALVGGAAGPSSSAPRAKSADRVQEQRLVERYRRLPCEAQAVLMKLAEMLAAQAPARAGRIKK